MRLIVAMIPVVWLWVFFIRWIVMSRKDGAGRYAAYMEKHVWEYWVAWALLHVMSLYAFPEALGAAFARSLPGLVAVLIYMAYWRGRLNFGHRRVGQVFFHWTYWFNTLFAVVRGAQAG